MTELPSGVRAIRVVREAARELTKVPADPSTLTKYVALAKAVQD